MKVRQRRRRVAATEAWLPPQHSEAFGNDMIRYLANRLWQSLLVLAVMSFVIYGLIGLMPGDPIDLMISADPRLSSEDVARLKEVYGLDRPLLDRYLAWLTAAPT